MLGGQRDLLADRLLLGLGVGEVEPALGREVTVDRVRQHDVLQALAVAQREAEDDRRLPLGLGAEHLPRQERVTALEKCQALARQPLVDADGVLGQELEVAAVSPAGLAARITALEHHHAQPGGARILGEVVGRRGAGEPGPDDDDVGRRRQARRRDW